MAIHMRNGIPYGGIPNGIVSGETPSTVPTTVKQLNQVGAVGKIAPVTIPSAVKFSNGDTLETAIGSVATIETSPTVATHEVGEFIFYNGQMYRVIATIAVGETLTVDTNIEATSVGAELTSLNNGLNGLHLISTVVNGTTTSFGTITIPNPAGRSTIFLLRNTYLDDVSGSFGVLNVDSTTDTTITLRCRTLKDGNINAGAPVITTLVFAYL